MKKAVHVPRDTLWTPIQHPGRRQTRPEPQARERGNRSQRKLRSRRKRTCRCCWRRRSTNPCSNCWWICCRSWALSDRPKRGSRRRISAQRRRPTLSRTSAFSNRVLSKRECPRWRQEAKFHEWKERSAKTKSKRFYRLKSSPWFFNAFRIGGRICIEEISIRRKERKRKEVSISNRILLRRECIFKKIS